MAEKRLTKEVAEQFLADDESVDSREFTELDDEAAEILRKHEGHLNLSGLTSLSDSAAKSLCGKNEEPTNESLENYDLLLNGLTSLSDAAAESLSKYKDFLGLNGLETLSDAAAESLSRYENEVLSLSGLTSLSDAAAESLSKYKGDLALNGLTSLSDAVAESLGKHKARFFGLSLNGLECLSDAAAESLNKYDGSLYVDFDNLPASTVEILRKHPSFQDDEDDE